MKNSRELTVLLLQTILEEKIFASEAKSKILPPDHPDQAFINMLLQTGLRHFNYIQSIIKTFTHKKNPKNSQITFYALTLATAEFIYLNTPDYAIINTYVDIVKKHQNKYIAGFTNAVLRKICAEKQRFKQENNQQFFPQEFRRLLNNSYNKKTVSAIEKASIKEPSLDLSVKDSFELENSQKLPLGSIRIPNNGNITQIKGYSQGLWWVQDFSSALPVNLLNNLTEKKVLDVCSAPGGKTAQLLAKGAKVTAIDISASRLKRLEENLSRLNLQTEATICADALSWLDNCQDELFDIVLLDAPCSATGTLRRHPELVHIKNLKDVEQMANIQNQMLKKAIHTIKKGGKLIYCTCSLSKQEGEQQISAFLQQHPEFKTSIINLPLELQELKTPEGWIRILPSHLNQFGGADGFFIAILDKEN